MKTTLIILVFREKCPMMDPKWY